ncbi:GOLPH3/VPS74 family protein [Thermomonospora echinospora]|nr:GPP34 family phosphoprotein [Thermomonospora echinospora]
MELTLAEELLLIVLKDDTGKPMIDGQRLSAALAGAALVELTLEGALRVTEDGDPDHRAGRLVATGAQPGDPRLAELVKEAHDTKPKNAVSRLSGVSAWRNRAKDLKEALLEDLTEQGVLTRERHKVLGLFPTTAWKPGDASVERRIVDRLRSVVVDGREPDERTAALVSILYAVDVLPKLFPDAPRKAVKERGKQISESDWGGKAVRQAVQAAQAALIATITAATAASTAGSAGS